MSTPIIEFTQDPNEDITNTPQHYHNFAGASVRVRFYWTTPILSNPGLLAHSFNLIRAADEILRKYTLRLDPQPSLASASAAFYAAAQAKAYAAFPDKLRPLVAPASPVRFLTDAVVDRMVDHYVDSTVAASAVLKFPGAIMVSDEGRPPVASFNPLRHLIEPVTEENRLIAVFMPLSGPADGFTAPFPDWLPWVVVDPRDYSDKSTLLHEIGHACRLAHQQEADRDYPRANEDYATANARRRNLMTYNTTTHDWLWGWQVDAIYDSYWCTGARPKNWWVRDILPPDHPFLWDEN